MRRGVSGCRSTTFRKLIHLRRGDPGPLPGSDPCDFFEAWLAYGTGGTCWAGNGALHALLAALGFQALRGCATMMVAPDLPPNHATVVVLIEDRPMVVDASILHGEPLPLSAPSGSVIAHRAWGVAATADATLPVIRWRPLHLPEGLDCRIDGIDVSADTFDAFHEASRPWSPFNYQLNARRNRGDDVIGCAFGLRVVIAADGTVDRQPLPAEARLRHLIEELGIAESLAVQVPPDQPTPPPPGSATARGTADAA